MNRQSFIDCDIRYLRGPEPDGGMVAMVVVVGGDLVGGKEGDFMECLHVEAQHCCAIILLLHCLRD